MVNSAEVGKRIKRKRSERKMTLRDVARRAGVSATLISDIERGKTSEAINSLSKISKALDEPIVHFIEDDYATEVAITHPGDRITVVSDLGDVQLSAVTVGIPTGHLDFVEATYEPGFASREAMVHHGEKCALVLEGELQVDIKDRVRLVPAGSSIHFNASNPHQVSNPLDRRTRVLWAVTPRLTVPVL